MFHPVEPPVAKGIVNVWLFVLLKSLKACIYRLHFMHDIVIERKERKEKFIKSMDISLTKIKEKKRSIKDINDVI